MPLTFAQTPLYYKDAQGNYHRILSGADMTGYRTAAAQDAIDAGLVSAAATQSFTEAQKQQARNNIGAIDAGSIATIESSPATQAHAVGDYIVYNGQLYKVTAAIAQGESLTAGTNIRSSKVADQIRTYATGTKTVNPNGNTYVYFLNKTELLNALGRSEVQMDKVCVCATNGDYDAAPLTILGVSRQQDVLIAHLSAARTGNMRITYAIFYAG